MAEKTISVIERANTSDIRARLADFHGKRYVKIRTLSIDATNARFQPSYRGTMAHAEEPIDLPRDLHAPHQLDRSGSDRVGGDVVPPGGLAAPHLETTKNNPLIMRAREELL